MYKINVKYRKSEEKEGGGVCADIECVEHDLNDDQDQYENHDLSVLKGVWVIERTNRLELYSDNNTFKTLISLKVRVLEVIREAKVFIENRRVGVVSFNNTESYYI